MVEVLPVECSGSASSLVDLQCEEQGAHLSWHCLCLLAARGDEVVTGDKPHFCLGIAAPPLPEGSAVGVAELSDGLASVGTEGLGQKGVQSDCGLPHSLLPWPHIPAAELPGYSLSPYWRAGSAL